MSTQRTRQIAGWLDGGQAKDMPASRATRAIGRTGSTRRRGRGHDAPTIAVAAHAALIGIKWRRPPIDSDTQAKGARMINRFTSAMLSATAVLVSALAVAPTAQAQSRGELLYSTHCIACHSSQMHWRDKKLATDWNSLKAQVRRWQAAAMLGWREDDIVDVARYLNSSFYHFEQTSDPLSSLSTGGS